MLSALSHYIESNPAVVCRLACAALVLGFGLWLLTTPDWILGVGPVLGALLGMAISE
jgi:hypothetical protein